jgi:hypothetical protein
MEKLPEAFGDIEVLDELGHPYRLGELWRTRTAVLLFVRHFG